jgi:hypothetical protein
MRRELFQFGKIKEKYREIQQNLFAVEYNAGQSRFTFFVLMYISGLFLIALCNLYFVWAIWIPYVLSSPNEIPRPT